MANRSDGLYLYADLTGTGWRYCKAAFAGEKIKPHILIKPSGTEESHPEVSTTLATATCTRSGRSSGTPRRRLPRHWRKSVPNWRM